VLGVGGDASLYACHVMISLKLLIQPAQRPPPLGRKFFTTFFASGSQRTIMPRASRMNLLVRLIMPWRLPAAADLTLPVPVILNRFLAADLVFILGILLVLSLRFLQLAGAHASAESLLRLRSRACPAVARSRLF